MRLKITPIFFISVILFSCGNNYSPKPLGYFRIDLPEKEYVNYSSGCPFEFQYPKYGEIEIPENNEPCWLNISFPEYDGKIYLSYKQVEDNLTMLTEDTRKLTYKHTIKAEAIQEKVYSNAKKDVYGMLYDIKGNAASSIQFYLTDSSNHFLRGSLYFNAQPNKDSLAPVIDFFREDIVHLMETVSWK